MLKQSNTTSIYELILRVKDNDYLALEILHNKFRPLIVKYSILLNISFDEVQEEFDLIIFKLSSKGISDESKLLKYIKVSLMHIKKFSACNDYEEYPENILGDTDVETNVFFDAILKDLNKITREMIRLKFIEQYTCQEISEKYGLSKQAVSKRINTGLNTLKNMLIKENISL
ncbi:RNA polymerase sigma factor [Clostridium mediterraneense]|uniref:RNA polymerase sigma factor n=1 Tax=Clostridium mediterraneense TaxID=1805472 RepID=UPI0008370E92|nr:sigma-70 family RNA polymerase sigma factor [Clostridium mediterraneense]